jgi:hypothetical protein
LLPCPPDTPAAWRTRGNVLTEDHVIIRSHGRLIGFALLRRRCFFLYIVIGKEVSLLLVLRARQSVAGLFIFDDGVLIPCTTAEHSVSGLAHGISTAPGEKIEPFVILLRAGYPLRTQTGLIDDTIVEIIVTQGAMDVGVDNGRHFVLK